VLLALLEYIDIRYIKVRERPDHRNAYTSPISRPPGKIPELRSDVEICGHLKASKPRSFLLCHRTSIEGVIVAEKPRSEITFHFHLWLSLFRGGIYDFPSIQSSPSPSSTHPAIPPAIEPRSAQSLKLALALALRATRSTCSHSSPTPTTNPTFPRNN
jgi:hypothetical protein